MPLPNDISYIRSEKLTIVLLTFNRLSYLKKAINSCLNQSDKNFNLLIVDNASNDGTKIYLENIEPPQQIKLEVILNKINIGAKGSFLLALSKIKQGWVTILCDDDLLDDTFVEKFYRLRKEFPKKLCFLTSFGEINVDGSTHSNFINPKGYFERSTAFKLISNGTIRPAGVSGFFFPASLIEISNYLKSVSNPHGYLEDTMMFLIASIQNGVVSTDEISYYRRIWPNQASSFSNGRMLDYFISLLLFDKALRERIADNEFSDIRKIHHRMSPHQFFKIIHLPIIANGHLTFNCCSKYIRSAYHSNPRYLPHALSMLFIWPFTFEATLSLRKKINSFRKKCLAINK